MTKAPLTNGKVYIGKDVDQASVSIAVGDTTGRLGAGHRPNRDPGFVAAASPSRVPLTA
jgi:hypothetical protein